MSFESVITECPRAEIAAYIDGELSSHDEMALELHMAECRTCATELNLQKQFLSALSSTLDSEEDLKLPENFTRVIVTSAESRVSGLRRSGERFNAVFICAALFLFVLFALGSEAAGVFSGAVRIFDQAVAVIGLIGHLVFNIMLGTTVILKSLTSQFIFNSSLAFILLAGILILSLLAFSRLIFRFSRTQ